MEYHLPRSSLIVFCRLAMLASRADRPSLNAASSLVSKVDPDLVLQSDHTDSTSHWDSVEFSSRPCSFSSRCHDDWSLSKHCDWSGRGFCWWAEVSAGLSPCCALTSGCDNVSLGWTEVSFLCSSTFPSLSAATHTCWVCVGSGWPRDIRYWVMRSVGCSVGSRLCCCWSNWVSDTELSTTVGQSDEFQLWRVLKGTEKKRNEWS